MAVVSQSGAILSCLLGALETSNTGVSKAIGYGNAIDIDEADIYEYLAKDRNTGVVISYIESLGDGRKFIEKAKILSGKNHCSSSRQARGKRAGGSIFAYRKACREIRGLSFNTQAVRNKRGRRF